MGISGGELQPPRVLRALEALKKAASQLHRQAAEAAAGTEDSEDDGGSSEDGDDNTGAVCSSLSMRALLELERQSEGLLGHDPDLEPLSRLLSRLRAVDSTCSSSSTCSPRPRRRKPSSSSSFLPASLVSLFGLRAGEECDGEDEEIARVAAGIEEEIQAWIDRENTYRLEAALRSLLRLRSASSPMTMDGAQDEEEEGQKDHHQQHHLDEDDESAVASLLSGMESRLSRGFDARYQSALLRSGAFPNLLAALTCSPSPSSPSSSSKLVRESCASAVAAAVRFNSAVFVGPVLSCSSSVVRSLAGMATPNSARALGALVSAIRTPLVDDMEARGEIASVVGLLRKPAELAEVALGAVMEMGRHGRRDAVWGMVEARVVERLVELELEYGIDEEEEEEEGELWWKRKIGVRVGEVGITDRSSDTPTGFGSFQGCVARFAVRVETGRGMGRRDKREVRAELVRRLRSAAEADRRAGKILAEVLWDIT